MRHAHSRWRSCACVRVQRFLRALTLPALYELYYTRMSWNVTRNIGTRYTCAASPFCSGMAWAGTGSQTLSNQSPRSPASPGADVGKPVPAQMWAIPAHVLTARLYLQVVHGQDGTAARAADAWEVPHPECWYPYSMVR